MRTCLLLLITMLLPAAPARADEATLLRLVKQRSDAKAVRSVLGSIAGVHHFVSLGGVQVQKHYCGADLDRVHGEFLRRALDKVAIDPKAIECRGARCDFELAERQIWFIFRRDGKERSLWIVGEGEGLLDGRRREVQNARFDRFFAKIRDVRCGAKPAPGG